MGVRANFKAAKLSELTLLEAVSVPGEKPVGEVIREMQQADRDFALVRESGRLEGIFTEWDFLHRVVGDASCYASPVRDHMSRIRLTL